MSDSDERMHDIERDKLFLTAMYDVLRANGAFPASGSDPAEMLRELKARSPSLVRRALTEGITDLLEATQDLDGDALARVDRYLVTRGAPTLTAKRLEQKRWLARLLKRGSLSSDEEYRAVLARLNATADLRWSAAQREQAEGMLSSYERRPK